MIRWPVSVLLFASVACCATAAGQAERLTLGAFSQGSTEGWENASFDDIKRSDYRIVTVDGRKALRGRCDDSASVFGIEREVDLNATPVLHWSWRVDRVYPQIDEQRKSGDDFVARVYAVIDGGLLKWRTRALNYVWASTLPVGTAWPNPFQSRAMMVAVQSGAGGGWRSESRNLKADFAEYFDKQADHIDGIALMTDCDNHGGTGQAYFGDIYFTAP